MDKEGEERREILDVISSLELRFTNYFRAPDQGLGPEARDYIIVLVIAVIKILFGQLEVHYFSGCLWRGIVLLDTFFSYYKCTLDVATSYNTVTKL